MRGRSLDVLAHRNGAAQVKRLLIGVLAALAIALGVAAPAQAYPTMPQGVPGPFTVTKVVDGETIWVDNNGQRQKIRMIGLDTPESVDPRKPVQCFCIEASAQAKIIVGGQSVYLETDPSQDTVDKDGRTLAYVWTISGPAVQPRHDRPRAPQPSASMPSFLEFIDDDEFWPPQRPPSPRAMGTADVDNRDGRPRPRRQRAARRAWRCHRYGWAPRAVGFVGDVGSIDGDPFVGVVVGVQEGVAVLTLPRAAVDRHRQIHGVAAIARNAIGAPESKGANWKKASELSPPHFRYG